MADARSKRLPGPVRRLVPRVSAPARLVAGPPGAIHLVGVSGVGMAGLAILLQSRGWKVSGCDLRPGPLSAWLAARGVAVATGHAPAHVARGVDAVIHSAAVPASCPELARARRLGLPLFRRGEVLAALVSAGRSIAVSGTHGKTTTTALIAHILVRAGLAPAFAVGGEAPQLGGVAAAGAGVWLVAEADESDGTLAGYAPEIAVITNIEFDHAEHYADLSGVAACFRTLASRARRLVVFGADDGPATEAAAAARQAAGVGLAPAAAWRAVRIRPAGSGSAFDVFRRGRRLGRVTLRLPGLHNVRNALAAAAAAAAAGVRWPVIAEALASFEGVGRRFERVADRDGIAVIADYAHHPTEIQALASAARRLPAARRMAVFQPHRYSRTRALGPAFPPAFDAFASLLLLPVYAASERPEPGGTVGDLYARFRECRAAPPLLASSAGQALGFLRRTLRPGDALFAVGAGDESDAVARGLGRILAETGAAGLDPVPDWVRAIRSLGLSRGAVCRANEPLARRTTFGLGGPADILVLCAEESDVLALRTWTLASGVPLTLLGAGGNVLVSDLGVRGVVARLAGPAFGRLTREDAGVVAAGAGVPLSRLADWTARRGLAGLEFLAGIPGTVGGALRMNAGACGGAIGERVVWVRYLDRTGARRVVSGRDLGFGYRSCAGLDGCVALAAGLAVESEPAARVRGRVRENLARRAWMAGLRCAGSVFRNPEAGRGEPAGALLDRLGFKGRRVGGARVSARHANVIEAGPGATASDVAALVEQIRVEVNARAGVALQEEVVRLE
jgi:UDP-N-acetylmuramate--L-alanine ligase/UDP-N-acetylenolpyruvoylglucosamine reductase